MSLGFELLHTRSVDDVIVGIREFNASADPPALLRSVLAGTHPYYEYRADVVKHGVPVRSMVYTTLLCHFSSVLVCYPDLAPSLGMPLSPVLTDTPFVRNGASVPDDVWDNVFSFLDQTSLLFVRLVCRIWSGIAIRYSHRRLRLRLPPDWMLSDRASLFETYCIESELALCIFLVRHGLLDAVESVQYVNWRLSPCCFFLYLLGKVCNVVIENDPCTLHTVLDIPYPFLLPPSVRELALVRCGLLEHSVEGLFSPGTLLVRLVLDSVQCGVLFVPYEPSGSLEAYTITRWRDTVGLSSHLRDEVRCPQPPSLRHVRLDFLATPYGRRIWGGDAFPGARGWEVRALVMQMFGFSAQREALQELLMPSETFPLRMRCDLIQSLDLALSNDMFGLVPEMCYVMGGALLDLTLRYPDQISLSPGRHSHARIHGLRRLERLTIQVAPRLWHFAALTVDTWISDSKSFRAAEFRAEFLYDPEEHGSIRMVTILQMRRIVDGSRLLGTAALGGILYFDLLVREGGMVVESDMIYADELLNELRSDVFTTAIISPCRRVDTCY
ncbi:uncharacterized protein ARMOST_12225 [Armillaria ostoyae]|uniref:F-box domain-containing protein n=1 Tax=Armillaria ostoyae TaxID=47428 RepID=A0A284RJB8_ARMOS|nr:uncharacterized protein ARMOST_12225 [Armillaria ostoyae]